MIENWYIDARIIEELHRDLMYEAEQRRLVRDIQQDSAKAQRPRRLAVLLALLGMQ